MSFTGSTPTKNQRSLVQLVFPDGLNVAVAYEPMLHAIRVSVAGERRLFFYEPDFLFHNKGSLLNEYGLVVGKMHCRSPFSGNIQLYKQKLFFEYEPASGLLSLAGTPNGTITCTCIFADNNEQQIDGLLLRSLAFTMAWWEQSQKPAMPL